ncbi:MAG TPA: class I tRNA ligase family protein, partial [Candidatus Paceibacterota bacterium]|nr:class I tRNA ligase family protein [Candidatus Paceibacterota bacterium]
TEEAKVFLKNYFSKRPFHAKGHTMTDAELKKFYDESMVFGKSVKEIGFKLFESFVKEIKKIKNAKIAVVSSGSCQYSEPALKKSKLKIEKLLTCEDSFSKEEKLEKIAKMWKVDLSDLYYFTDANNDVYELENLLDRKKIIGCSWGYIGYDALRETLPEDQVLKKPKDIHDVFKPLLGRRETNTMPQWAGSSWYWLRYMDPKNKKEFASKKAQKYWSPVDLYFGGMEHTTLHLLYSRFWNLFLYDRGLVTVKEPYKKRVPHGIILGPDGEKMSKSRGNVVNPDELIALYGADTVRLYMMFLGPHGAQVAWNDKGIVGARRFLERVLQLPTLLAKEEDKEVTKLLHKTIKKVEEDLETFSFNTAVSAMMIFVNKVYELKSLTKKSLMSFLELLAPMAPHLTEEMWQTLGNKGSIFTTKWPKFDPKHILETEITIVVQVNGKVRTKLLIPASLEEAEVVKRAQSDEQVVKFIEGKELKKAIYIKGKLVNLVI